MRGLTAAERTLLTELSTARYDSDPSEHDTMTPDDDEALPDLMTARRARIEVQGEYEIVFITAAGREALRIDALVRAALESK